MAKYNTGQRVFFCGVSHIDFNFIMFENKIGIPLTLQSYLLNQNYTYLPLPGMDITETVIRKHLCWYGIRNAVWKEVSNFDTYQRTKGQI